MISKKGEQSLIFWVMIAVIGGVALYLGISGAWRSIQPVVFVLDLIGFNATTVAQGNGVVGVNIATGNLEYYTGESFKKFTGQEVALLGGYEFNIIDVQTKISDFYFNTERRPSNFFNIKINNWRYWALSLSSLKHILVEVRAYTIPGFMGPLTEQKYGLMDGYSSSLNYSYFPYKPNEIIVKDGYLSNFIELDSKYAGNHLNEAFEWVDSILQGNKCEKFLTLRVKQNGLEKDLTYTVRKVDHYITVDFTKPLTLGVIEKWNNPKCFEKESYFDYIQDTPKIYDNPSKVEFYYTNLDGYDLFGQDVDEKLTYSSEKGWTYQRSWGINNVDEESINRAPEIYRQLAGNNLYSGLILLTKKEGIFSQKEVVFKNDGKTNHGVFVNKIPVKIKIDGRKWDSLDSEKDKVLISEFIYEILNKYNSLAIFSEGELNA